jgi:HK97 family phage prohead protease
MSKNQPKLSFKYVPVKGFKILDEEQGIVEAFVSGIGNKDKGDDIIDSGAFDESLKKIWPKGVWCHDMSRPISKTLECFEIGPGDSRLPDKMKAAGIGGLYVKAQFNTNVPDGQHAFEWAKFFGPEQEWSIGYNEVETKWDSKAKANRLKQIDLYEYSMVPFGMNPLTATVGVKTGVSDQGETIVDIKLNGMTEEQDEAIRLAVKGIMGEGNVEFVDADEVEGEEVDAEKARASLASAALEEEATEDLDVEDEGGEEEDAAEAVAVVSDEDEDSSDDADAEVDSDDDDATDDAADEDEDSSDDADAADDSDDADSEEEGDSGEKAIHPVIESFMAYGDKVKFDPADARKALDFIEERIDTKTVEGSTEQRLTRLAKAGREEFSSNSSYVSLYATFDSTAIFYMYDYKEGESFFEVSYSVSDEGEISFGEEKAVDVVEVVMAKRAVMEAAFKGHFTEVKSALAAIIEASEGADPDLDVKAEFEGMLEESGRSFSKKGRELIESAVKSLSELLEAGSVEDAEEDVEDPEGSKAEELEVTEGQVDEAPSGKKQESEIRISSEELEDLKAAAREFLDDED